MTVTSDIDMQAQPRKKEGKMTQAIESKTGKVPSGTYLGFAIGSMIASAAFMLAGKRHVAMFIGQWVPSLLVIGLYNKVVKLEDEVLEREQALA